MKAGKYEKAKGRSHKSKFVQLEGYIIKSEAFECLSPRALKLYVYFKWRYNGHNNGEVHFSNRDAAKALKCTTGTAAKAIKELEDKGFIKCRFKGKFDHKVHQASEFILTEYEYNNNKPTKDFMKWRMEEE